MSTYEPELGQLLFGQPFHEKPMPYEWETYLDTLGAEVERLTEEENPTVNTGAALYCELFRICSYRWDENDNQPNFLHVPTGLEIRWYKHSHRGATTSDPTADFPTIALECIAFLRNGASYTTDPTEYKVTIEGEW